MVQLKFVIENWLLFNTEMSEDGQDGLASESSDVKLGKLSLTPETPMTTKSTCHCKLFFGIRKYVMTHTHDHIHKHMNTK